MIKRYVSITTTLDDRQALEKMAEVVVDRKLAACAQVSGPLKSFFYWKGNKQVTEEWKIEFKTEARFFEAVKREIIVRHPYQTPEIICTEISDGSPDYLGWISSSILPGGVE